MIKITFSIACLVLLTGCSTTNASSSTSSPIIYSSDKQQDQGYMYNRANNLEYMDAKSIEKFKRAVSLLIDKVDNLEARVNQKLDRGALDKDLLILKKDIDQLREEPVNIQEHPIKKRQFSSDDEKILNYIQEQDK